MPGQGRRHRSVAECFLVHLRQLQAAGAAVAAITSIGGHFCIAEAKACSPMPVLDAIPVLAREVERRGLRSVGLLGTRRVMDSWLSGGLPGCRVVAPEGEALDRAPALYVAMAQAAHCTGGALRRRGIARARHCTGAQRDEIRAIGRDLCEHQGAELVLLAGTDLFHTFGDVAPDDPVLDCADVQLDALHRVATGQE